MVLAPLKSFQSADYEMSKAQAYVKEFASQLTETPFIRGKIFTINLSPGNNSIQHKLRSIPSGWFILDKNAATDIWRTGWDDLSITLNSTNAVSISLWVF